MSKKAIALAIAGAFSMGAFAQSSVTIYGKIDVGYSYSNISSTKFTQAANQVNGGRIGFTGTEDLGNGLRAGFVVEQGFSADTGTTGQNGGLGGRQSYISLKKDTWGEVRAGRQYTLLDDWAGNYSPLSTSGYAYGSAGYIVNDDQGRLNNALTYYSPKWSGLQVSLQAAPKESTSNGAYTNSSTATLTGESRAHYAAALNYTNGPLALGLALSKNYGLDTDLDLNNKVLAQLGGTYDLGFLKLFAQYEYDGTKADYGVSGSDSYGKKNAYLVGINVPAGAWLFKAGIGYAENANRSTSSILQGSVTQFALGADYLLSKRTKLYAGLGVLKGQYDADGTRDGQRTAKAAVTGIVHQF
ncbi:MAG: porin [Comamonas sp.]